MQLSIFWSMYIAKATKTKLSRQMDSKPIRNTPSDVHLNMVSIFAKYACCTETNLYIWPATNRSYGKYI